ncbi:Collagen alpha-2(IV) chain [Lamellibrachia satsuma]|nr:Collagen alpha-2(IV) chain [Lamellibrachia satsuma]
MGPRGFQGRTGPSAYIYTKHSQMTVAPGCPLGYIKLWDGFSLLHTEDDGRAHVQDLGTSGSCMRKFSPTPYLFCTIHNVCRYASRTATSFWLASQEPVPMMPVGAQSLMKYVGRCSVCQAPGPLLTVHSQNIVLPDCPRGWHPLWSGYSFVMHAVGAMGGGQSLASPGSCLEKFRLNPYIECNSRGECHFFSDKFSFWLVSITGPTNHHLNLQGQTFRAEQLLDKIGRCRVCMLDTVRDDLYLNDEVGSGEDPRKSGTSPVFGRGDIPVNER